MRLVNSEITKKIDELRRELNSQLVDVINSAITEKVLPDIRNLVSNQNPVFREEVDQRSSGLNRTTEAKFVKNAWKGNSKLNMATSSRQDYFRRNSENSQSSDDGHEEDIMTNSHDSYIYLLNTERSNSGVRINDLAISLRCATFLKYWFVTTRERSFPVRLDREI